MNRSILLLAGLSAAGLFTGFAAKRVSHRETSSSEQTPANQRARSSSPDPSNDSAGSPASRSRSALPDLPALHSTDTIESLLAIPDDSLYGRLAVWMMDASEEDIAAFWKVYSQKKDRSNDINDLVFINWTRLDPQAAIAGAGEGNIHYAWWAWACHDPAGSLAAAIAANKDRVNNVAWGIGEFHPAWLREHFQEIPESGRSNAIQGMMKWDDGQNPLDSLKFLKENGIGLNAGTLKALVRQDPWAALDWVKENPGSLSNDPFADNDPFSDNPSMQLVVDTMASEHPEYLARLVAQTPSGMLKLKMESALFDNLLKTDPEAALEQAKNAPAPRIAAERYAAIGLGIVKSDPEAAFQYAKDLLTACPEAMSMYAKIKYPGGSSFSSIQVAGVTEFVEILSEKDPARVLEMTFDLKPVDDTNRAFGTLSSQWLERDPVAYTQWVNRQTDENFRDQGAGLIAKKLWQEGNYPEAAEWAMSMRNRDNQVPHILHSWKQADPDAASQWLEKSSLTADQKEKIKTRFAEQQ